MSTATRGAGIGEVAPADRVEVGERVDTELRRARWGELVAVLWCRVERLAPGGEMPRGAGVSADRDLRGAVTARFGPVLGDGVTIDWPGGSDLLIITAPDVRSERDLGALAQRLLDAARRPVERPDGSAERLNLSIGIASTVGRARHPAQAGSDRHTSHQATGDRLLAAAKVAMAEARRSGGDRCVVFEPAVGAGAEARRTLEQELQHALDAEQLAVEYQPVIDLRTGSVTQVEALVRWPHPVRGMVHPATFLPLAVEIGLISRISRWVIGVGGRPTDPGVGQCELARTRIGTDLGRTASAGRRKCIGRPALA